MIPSQLPEPFYVAGAMRHNDDLAFITNSLLQSSSPEKFGAFRADDIVFHEAAFTTDRVLTQILLLRMFRGWIV